jgi:hypothetical protein
VLVPDSWKIGGYANYDANYDANSKVYANYDANYDANRVRVHLTVREHIAACGALACACGSIAFVFAPSPRVVQIVPTRARGDAAKSNEDQPQYR